MLLPEEHPRVVFIVQAISAGDVESDLEFLKGLVEAAFVRTFRQAQFLAQAAGSERVQPEHRMDFLSEGAALIHRNVSFWEVEFPQVIDRHQNRQASGNFAIKDFFRPSGRQFVFPRPDRGDFLTPPLVARLAAGQINNVPQTWHLSFVIRKNSTKLGFENKSFGLEQSPNCWSFHGM